MNPDEHDEAVKRVMERFAYASSHTKTLQEQLLDLRGSSTDATDSLKELRSKLEALSRPSVSAPSASARLTEGDVMKFIRDDINSNILNGDDAVLEAAGRWLTKVTNAINDIVRKAGGEE